METLCLYAIQELKRGRQQTQGRLKCLPWALPGALATGWMLVDGGEDKACAAAGWYRDKRDQVIGCHLPLLSRCLVTRPQPWSAL